MLGAARGSAVRSSLQGAEANCPIGGGVRCGVTNGEVALTEVVECSGSIDV